MRKGRRAQPHQRQHRQPQLGDGKRCGAKPPSSCHARLLNLQRCLPATAQQTACQGAWSPASWAPLPLQGNGEALLDIAHMRNRQSKPKGKKEDGPVLWTTVHDLDHARDLQQKASFRQSHEGERPLMLLLAEPAAADGWGTATWPAA